MCSGQTHQVVQLFQFRACRLHSLPQFRVWVHGVCVGARDLQWETSGLECERMNALCIEALASVPNNYSPPHPPLGLAPHQTPVQSWSTKMSLQPAASVLRTPKKATKPIPPPAPPILGRLDLERGGQAAAAPAAGRARAPRSPGPAVEFVSSEAGTVWRCMLQSLSLL